MNNSIRKGIEMGFIHKMKKLIRTEVIEGGFNKSSFQEETEGVKCYLFNKKNEITQNGNNLGTNQTLILMTPHNVVIDKGTKVNVYYRDNIIKKVLIGDIEPFNTHCEYECKIREGN